MSRFQALSGGQPFPSETHYQALRSCLSSAYQGVSEADLSSYVQRVLSGMTAEEQEGFWRSVGNVARRVGSGLVRAAPGAIQGAVTGMMTGGPWGALLGAVGGGVAGSMGRPSSSPSSGPAMPQPATAQVPAAAQLLQLIQRPEVLQALTALTLGRAGQPNVPAGPSQTPVPPAAFLNALSQLSTQAAWEASQIENGEASPAYLLDESGEYRCDPANPEERAARLLELLRESGGEAAAASARRPRRSAAAALEWLVEAGCLQNGQGRR